MNERYEQRYHRQRYAELAANESRDRSLVDGSPMAVHDHHAAIDWLFYSATPRVAVAFEWPAVPNK